METRNGQHHIAIQLRLGSLDANPVAVELFADATGVDNEVLQVMERVRTIEEAAGVHLYAGMVPANRPQAEYTVRPRASLHKPVGDRQDRGCGMRVLVATVSAKELVRASFIVTPCRHRRLSELALRV
ncbi:MAG: hypothetical protein U0163_19010 [Gemmatimonadaceae bacterium]